MVIVNLEVVSSFLRSHPRARKPFERWRLAIEAAQVDHAQAIQQLWPPTRVVNAHTVIFNLSGNHYRLLVSIDFQRQEVLILRFGTHGGYDKWKL